MLDLWQYRSLIWRLTWRDVEQRYRNSVFGVLWLVGQPLIQLALYSFVFQVVLRSRWGIHGSGGPVPFALILFVGLMLHVMLADMFMRAPAAVTSNVSYVKRVIFPVQILPVVFVGSSLLTLMLALTVLVVATLLIVGHLPVSALLLFVPVLALLLMTLGLAWLMAGLGVYLRDLNQLAPHISMILMFTAPVVYPSSMVPERFHWLLFINPLTLPVVMARQLLFQGVVDFSGLPTYLLVACLVLVGGRWMFERLRVGFADVL